MCVLIARLRFVLAALLGAWTLACASQPGQTIEESFPRLPQGSNPVAQAARGGLVYFTRDSPNEGVELWRTDGTPAGTALVKDIVPGPEGSSPRDLNVLGDTLLFFTAEGLWKTDGTRDGTVLVKTLDGRGTARPIVSGRHLYFTGRSRRVRVTGYGSLWRSDGTSAGTVEVFTGTDDEIDALTDVSGTLFYVRRGLEAGGPRPAFPITSEVWRSDGTEAGTVPLFPVRDFCRECAFGSLVARGPALYFGGAYDTQSGLWRSDGSVAGTALVKSYSWVSSIFNNNGTLFFITGREDLDSELWASDGTAAGTRVLRSFVFGLPIAPPPSSTRFASVNGMVFFAASGAEGRELWKSDGTPGGTVLVRDIYLTGSSDPRELTPVGNTLFFTAEEPTAGRELWKTDGTADGTVRVADILPGLAGSMQAPSSTVPTAPGSLLATNGRLFFTATDGRHGRELWTSDGTEAGTTRLTAYSEPLSPLR